MRIAIIAALFVTALASPAMAQVDLFSRDTVSGIVDLRLGVSSGEKSWIQGGFGKARYGGGNGGAASVRAEIATADLVWNPSIEDVSLVLDLQAQPSQSHGVDLAQAYVQYKPAPTSALRINARAGLFYPPISMEHEGYAGGAWTVADTITPSAINAWIGHEVKVVGVEGQVRYTLGGHELGATAGLFGYDDTAGTLLALNGWSLDDITGTATGRLPLAPMNSFIKFRQAPFTEPVRELDERAGYYARLDWRLPSRLTMNFTYYDNGGDMVAVDRLQWSWLTRFWNVGARLDLDDRTRIIGQVLYGSTYMGYPRGDSVWVDVDYNSAFLMASRTYGRATVSGRVETFATANEGFTPVENYSENGWAVTGDYKFALTRNVALLGEILHVSSNRPARILTSTAPHQAQTTAQASARFTF